MFDQHAAADTLVHVRDNAISIRATMSEVDPLWDRECHEADGVVFGSLVFLFQIRKHARARLSLFRFLF